MTKFVNILFSPDYIVCYNVDGNDTQLNASNADIITNLI